MNTSTIIITGGEKNKKEASLKETTITGTTSSTEIVHVDITDYSKDNSPGRLDRGSTSVVVPPHDGILADIPKVENPPQNSKEDVAPLPPSTSAPLEGAKAESSVLEVYYLFFFLPEAQADSRHVGEGGKSCMDIYIHIYYIYIYNLEKCLNGGRRI